MVRAYSLYFHIPFCTKKCDYCHFYVIPDQLRYKDLLMGALEKHWKLAFPLLSKKSPCSIYFGGGTPSLMSADAIAEILSWISFDETTEITLEVNPENASFEKMKEFQKAGINRVSIGAQTFDNHLLKQIGRTHLAEETHQAVVKTFQAGISNISLDLMYDLPNQGLISWQNSLEEALSLPITHLSLYNLTIEPHTVFYKYKESISKLMPKENVSFQMLQTAVEACEKKGFHRYEISAFAKPNYHSVHNTGYWQDRPFLGFGPSAFSYWEKKRFRNVANLHQYSKALENNKSPCDFQEELPFEEHMKEKLAIALRMMQGTQNEAWPESIHRALHELQEKKLIKMKEDRIQLTEQGLLFHDTVAEIIFSY